MGVLPRLRELISGVSSALHNIAVHFAGRSNSYWRGEDPREDDKDKFEGCAFLELVVGVWNSVSVCKAMVAFLNLP